jgi:hypothetical protein
MPDGVADLLGEIEHISAGAVRSETKARRLVRWAFDGHPWHAIVTNGTTAAIACRIVDEIAAVRGVAVQPYDADTTQVEFHNAEVPLPTRLLRVIAHNDNDFDLMVEALTEGPHHEVAANVIILALLEAIFDLSTGVGESTTVRDIPAQGGLPREGHS